MPSRTAALLAACRYKIIGSRFKAWARRRIDSASAPSRSTMSRAAASTTSRVILLSRDAAVAPGPGAGGFITDNAFSPATVDPQALLTVQAYDVDTTLRWVLTVGLQRSHGALAGQRGTPAVTPPVSPGSGTTGRHATARPGPADGQPGPGAPAVPAVSPATRSRP